MLEVTKEFRFEAAHTLQRDIGAEGSRRIHGHSYRAVVAVRGRPDPATGMVIDLERLEQAFAAIRAQLDHRFLDEVAGLGPATMENLALWIWRHLAPDVAGLARVTIHRDSLGESCTYQGE
jgi:6-pyruvoyltetrahydropterin/6-carboxytetrahydropterin synthase